MRASLPRNAGRGSPVRFARYECSGARSDGVLAPEGTCTRSRRGADRGLIGRGGCAALLAAGAAALDAAPGPAVADVRLLAPLHPASIRDSVSFEAHVEGARSPRRARPDPVPRPVVRGAVLLLHQPARMRRRVRRRRALPRQRAVRPGAGGRRRLRERGRNLTPEEAAPGIVGYMIFNDWSARDIQRLEGQLPFGFVKGKDGAHTLGPYLVTADELAPPDRRRVP